MRRRAFVRGVIPALLAFLFASSAPGEERDFDKNPPTYDELVTIGREKTKTKNYEDAFVALVAASSVKKERFEAYAALALMNRDKGQLLIARSYALEAIKRVPKKKESLMREKLREIESFTDQAFTDKKVNSLSAEELKLIQNTYQRALKAFDAGKCKEAKQAAGEVHKSVPGYKHSVEIRLVCELVEKSQGAGFTKQSIQLAPAWSVIPTPPKTMK